MAITSLSSLIARVFPPTQIRDTVFANTVRTGRFYKKQENQEPKRIFVSPTGL